MLPVRQMFRWMLHKSFDRRCWMLSVRQMFRWMLHKSLIENVACVQLEKYSCEWWMLQESFDWKNIECFQFDQCLGECYIRVLIENIEFFQLDKCLGECYKIVLIENIECFQFDKCLGEC
jgi:hypothetical protein